MGRCTPSAGSWPATWIDLKGDASYRLSAVIARSPTGGEAIHGSEAKLMKMVRPDRLAISASWLLTADIRSLRDSIVLGGHYAPPNTATSIEAAARAHVPKPISPMKDIVLLT